MLKKFVWVDSELPKFFWKFKVALSPMNFLWTNVTLLTNFLLYVDMLNDMQFKPKLCLTTNVAFVTGQSASVLIFMTPVHLAKNVVLKTMMDAHFPPTTAAAINKVRNLRNNLMYNVQPVPVCSFMLKGKFWDDVTNSYWRLKRRQKLGKNSSRYFWFTIIRKQPWYCLCGLRARLLS